VPTWEKAGRHSGGPVLLARRCSRDTLTFGLATCPAGATTELQLTHLLEAVVQIGLGVRDQGPAPPADEHASWVGRRLPVAGLGLRRRIRRDAGRRRLAVRGHAATEARRNLRIVCPDELTSNKLDAVLEVAARAWQ
jgi:hypothetical protein